MSMAEEARSRLGRGLAALIGDMGSETQVIDRGRGQRRVPIEFLKPNPKNPRRLFSEAELDELAASIKERGIIQPIVVRPAKGQANSFEIIAGERRWRAAQRAGLHDVPVTILDVSDREALELAIVENVQRADLNPIEEARGYQALLEEFQYSQGELGDTIGKSRVHVTNTLRLLKLPASVLALLENGTLSAGHGRALLSAADPEALARIAVQKKLSVREVEELAKQPDVTPRPKPERRVLVKNADHVALEKELSDVLGMKVEIKDAGEGRGEVTVLYRSLEQLDYLIGKIRK
jgi:ParB family transcriptional regulator, chromosome partitioning protein